MSIPLECINIVIPITSLNKCPSISDVSEFLAEKTCPGSGCWRDAHLYREGTMNELDLMLALGRWKEMGLKPTRRRNGVEEWHELCVVDTFAGPTKPCCWLQYNPDSLTVSMMPIRAITRHAKKEAMAIAIDDKVSPELDIALDDLRQSPLFHLSLASKELFHSNFIGWCCEVWPEQTAKIWSNLVTGLPEHYSKEPPGKNIRREHNNHDLEIDFEGNNLLVVELKVKSLASEGQLQEYAKRMKPKDGMPPPRLVLMSLIEPDFFENDPKTLNLDNGIDCSWVDLSIMSNKLKESLTHDPPTGYLEGLLADYEKFVMALKGVTTIAAKVEEEGRFFLKKADCAAITDMRLHDLVFKLRYQQLGMKVQERLPKDLKFGVKAEMSNCAGMITVDFKLDVETLGNLGELGIGIQLQGNMFRQYFSSKNNEEGIGDKLHGICDRLRINNIWLNDHNLSDSMSEKSAMRNKNDYCKFGDNFFYNYRNLKEDVTATQIAEYISKKMVYLQSKEEDIVRAVKCVY